MVDIHSAETAPSGLEDKLVGIVTAVLSEELRIKGMRNCVTANNRFTCSGLKFQSSLSNFSLDN